MCSEICLQYGLSKCSPPDGLQEGYGIYRRAERLRRPHQSTTVVVGHTALRQQCLTNAAANAAVASKCYHRTSLGARRVCTIKKKLSQIYWEIVCPGAGRVRVSTVEAQTACAHALGSFLWSRISTPCNVDVRLHGSSMDAQAKSQHHCRPLTCRGLVSASR